MVRRKRKNPKGLLPESEAMKEYAVEIGDQKSDQVPHRKCQVSDQTFYVAQYPEGDYCIHMADRSQRGYGGDVITFLMQDGTVERVKGPFRIGGSVTIYSATRYTIADELGIDRAEFCRQAVRLTVGRGLWKTMAKDKEVVHSDEWYSLQPVRERLKPEWAGLDLAIGGREIIVYKSVDEILNASASV
jgi:hypothetical protein